MKTKQRIEKREILSKDFDITLLQTPKYGQKKGYKQVYRLKVEAVSHEEAMEIVFRQFNVADLIPRDYHARYVGTGDVILVDEGLEGMTYYKLTRGGWKKIHRVYVM